MVVLNVGKMSQQIKQVKKNLLLYLMSLPVVGMMIMVLDLKHQVIPYLINYHLVAKVNKFHFIYVHQNQLKIDD
jgi:hypothetical protein